MSTQSDSFGFVRTLIQGDFEANGQYKRRLDEQGWAGFPRFLTAVFFLAADRRFAMPPDRAEIVKFVAELRGRGTGDVAGIDPEAAEVLILAVLDAAVTVNLDQATVARIQTLVAHKILTDENLTPEELDAFLGRAEQLTSRQP